ncbi:MAG TPA: type I methionyl aminopeptidase [Candidatus Saccharimonadales bacterium]|nr:type I methionyl aminopeptidase [Candidatus Saccharimonadales bacterium]
MIDYKTAEEIKIMQHGGHILATVLNEVMDAIRPGITELELDQLAEKRIRALGGEPGFMKVDGYYHTTCFSTNDVVVHGIPSNYKIKENDVVGIDCGVFYKGFHTDMSDSRRVKVKNAKKDEVDTFLEVGKYALDEAIKQAVVGNRVGHISQTIQRIVEKEAGYGVVRSLIGHGVGRELHEAPEVPGYLIGNINRTPLLKVGMTIAVEVIYNMGTRDVMLDPDQWTIRTADGKLAGLYERTIAITEDGPLMITE